MRRIRKGIFVCGFIVLMALNLFVLATVSYGDIIDRKYMAGTNVKDKDGNVIGCSCPVRLGSCICIINTPPPNNPGI